jgi:hypothetical protein
LGHFFSGLLNVGTRQEIDAMFAVLGSERPDALFVSSDTFFTSWRVQLVSLAISYAIQRRFRTASMPKLVD